MSHILRVGTQSEAQNAIPDVAKPATSVGFDLQALAVLSGRPPDQIEVAILGTGTT